MSSPFQQQFSAKSPLSQQEEIKKEVKEEVRKITVNQVGLLLKSSMLQIKLAVFLGLKKRNSLNVINPQVTN